MYYTSQIKVPLNIINDPIIDLNLSRNHKTVQKLILFKEPPTNINIETLGNVFNQELNSFLKHFLLIRNLQSPLEKFHEIVQRVLIHGVDNAHVTDHEIYHTAPFCD